MIYTITLNPSIDYFVDVKDFELGKTNRSESDEIRAGGKGINVSSVLSNFGIKSTALGFLAGPTGEILKNKLSNMNFNSNFTQVDNGHTRINVKFLNYDGTEINAKGPHVSKKDIDELLNIVKAISPKSFVVISGSIPGSVPDNIYKQIAEILHKNNVNFIVDTTGKNLIDTIQYKPQLIKPNIYELEQLIQHKLVNTKDIIKAAEKLTSKGARNVIVSMGKDGAIFVSQTGNVFIAKSPEGKLIDSVGAGDSMIAGYIYAIIKGINEAQQFTYAIATGSATAFSKELATKEQANMLLNKIQVQKKPGLK